MLALGWFFTLPRALGRLLADCVYAVAFHNRALHTTREPFLRKEDNPLNGFWLYKCLREAGQPPVTPLPSLGRHEAHNMACVSAKGMYRRPSNASVIVHFLKSESAMRYVGATFRASRQGQPVEARRCCSRTVWKSERGGIPPEVCYEILTEEEREAERKLDGR